MLSIDDWMLDGADKTRLDSWRGSCPFSKRGGSGGVDGDVFSLPCGFSGNRGGQICRWGFGVYIFRVRSKKFLMRSADWRLDPNFT